MNAVIEHMSTEGKNPGEKSAGEHEKQHVSGLGRDHSIPHPHPDEARP
jgi:membrane protein